MDFEYCVRMSNQTSQSYHADGYPAKSEDSHARYWRSSERVAIRAKNKLCTNFGYSMHIFECPYLSVLGYHRKHNLKNMQFWDAVPTLFRDKNMNNNNSSGHILFVFYSAGNWSIWVRICAQSNSIRNHKFNRNCPFQNFLSSIELFCCCC